ncbi:hypothetical protein JHK85_041789 [Glycine max]|nr:hypothetical protein JHK85_041789 [Glycine max]
MMVDNPNWWSMHQQPSLIPPQYVFPPSSIPFNSLTENQEPPQSWSQLFFTGLPGEEEKLGPKKLENWNVQDLNTASRVPFLDVIRQQVSQRGNLYDHGPSWSHMVPVSSPVSCVTSFSSNNILDFTYNKSDHRRNLQQDQISKCNSTATVGVCKKARVQPSSSQAPLKTDTASVLLEAIGYIRFLQGQIEALSSPYLGSASKNMRNQQSLLNDNNIGLKRKGAPNQAYASYSDHDAEDHKAKDLKSRGLCLVPVSCTQNMHVGSYYWAPAYGRGF